MSDELYDDAPQRYRRLLVTFAEAAKDGWFGVSMRADGEEVHTPVTYWNTVWIGTFTLDENGDEHDFARVVDPDGSPSWPCLGLDEFGRVVPGQRAAVLGEQDARGDLFVGLVREEPDDLSDGEP